ncbi:isochorismate synthase [Nocardiopsis ansamitocini]|uniref:isochorismate synthase n=1 Tax=Nocardiopsis ansamitocini TaxID=1670832 RepID=A0A9W6UKY9_9ACTN|nr:isochorismate synthase [Nocardiopsis ansamitocini]GLU50207.1 isochorismate synthase DhbC [Nocardiopsis ansamitocini]
MAPDRWDHLPGKKPGPLDALHAYRPGDFVFTTPGHTLLARDMSRTRVQRATGEHLGAAFDAARRSGLSRPVAVGALAFDPAAPAHIAVPHEVVMSGRSPRGGSGDEAPARPRIRAHHRVPDEHGYTRAVARAIDRVTRTELDKVVLARTLRLVLDHPVDPGQLLRRLASADPAAHVFAVDVPPEHGGARRTLLGASPELLVARRGPAVHSHPLAGSAARDPDPATDRRRARELVASAKDRHEHAFVVAALAESLSPFCAELHVPEAPSVTATSTMWHLGTRITGRLAEPLPSSLDLARAVHPTPAVCGTPTRLALEAIGELEPFDRGHYAGAVGWCDADGDGEWAVALRCAEVEGDEARLFAGAGIVADSDPVAELAETSAKFRTMLDAFEEASPHREPPVDPRSPTRQDDAP